jgi:hypothetical protein
LAVNANVIFIILFSNVLSTIKGMALIFALFIGYNNTFIY